MLALLALPGTAQAKWLEASSDHFVIYADDTPADIEQFSQQLERFHVGMTLLLDAPNPRPSPSNRVTVFIVRSDREVRKLAGDGAQFVYAFYHPRAGGSIAIVPQIEVKTGRPDFSMVALLHEYAHHFQLSAARFPWPRWFVEGSAEFFSAAKFEKDGGMMLGMPASHRANEIFYAPDVTATDLLDPERYEKKGRKGFDAYYGKAWLLYHFLTFSKERSGQFAAYLKLLQQGQTSATAARTTFGDLGQLEKDLERYAMRRTMTAIDIPARSLQPGSVTVRTLSEGEAAIMPVRIRSRRGVNAEQALKLLPEARTIAARYSSDAAVLSALAEAEYDAGNDDPAITAADAALAIDPNSVNAYLQKGYALYRKAADADDKAKAYRAARAPFLALNKIENDHPLPLLYFYMSFARQGGQPSENAVQALERASELAPFDLGLRMMLARQQISAKQYDRAITNLAPIAYNPHGGDWADKVRTLLDRLKAGQDLDKIDPGKLFAELEQADAEEEPTGTGDGEDKPKGSK